MQNIAYKKIILILIVAAAIFLDRLDITIVNIALPKLAHVFHVSVTQLDWVSNSYLIALACFIPISGWVGERYGLKKTFILSTAFFAVGTLLCALSFNLISIVIARFIQGIGGGMIIPVGMTLIYKKFEHDDYARITSFIFLPTLLAPGVAPFLGAVIMTFWSWHWIFLVAIPVCLLIILSAYYYIEMDIPDKSLRKPCDQLGVILTSGFLIAIQLFLSEVGRTGLTMNVLMIFGLACSLFYFWYKHEVKTPYPLIKLSYFKNKMFISANLLQLVFQASHFGSFFLIGLYLQVGVGFSAIHTGLIIGMQAVGALCTGRLSAYLYQKYGAYMPVVMGLLGIGLFSYGILFFVRSNSDAMLFTGMGILFLRGISSGLCGVPIQTLGVISFKKHEMADINAIFNTCRQISISLGIALSSLLIGYGAKIENSNLTNYHQPYTIVQGTFQYAFILIPIFCISGILVSAYMFLNER
ncbi:MAG: DHA2 family efflux MFS transporter permease subunit [Gammaproteobacteria bacterium]|nr:DHA2 family efflux MFS transporter permease subunit [Gammaproteobacteria bacterium]